MRHIFCGFARIHVQLAVFLVCFLSASAVLDVCAVPADGGEGEPADTSRVRISRRGIIIDFTDSCVRAMEPFCGTEARGAAYADVVNEYKVALGDSIAVYCMPIPTAIEFYRPDDSKVKTRRERPVIDAMFSRLSADVVPVDVYKALKEHAGEPIYSRTDHHWAPLGAYYAAREFAAAADVPFYDLSEYERKVVKGYVGSMYTFSKDTLVKNSPEDFVYYVPRGVDYVATYINYRLGRNRHVISESKPEEHDFFLKYPDGSRGAYCTFMGGDLRTVKVVTSTRNGRRLAIFKDSYGNAVPGYLFRSFEEIHVLDFRYFNKSIKKYVKDNHITDLLFVNNLTHACMPGTCATYREILGR